MLVRVMVLHRVLTRNLLVGCLIGLVTGVSIYLFYLFLVSFMIFGYVLSD